MTQPTPESPIAQTFAYVAEVYAETAVFMKDLKAAPALKGFTCLTGNANGHSGSRSLDWPRQWFPRYVSGVWMPERPFAHGPKATYLAASVLFFDLEERAIDPVLVYGVVGAMDHPQAAFQNWWLWDAHFNKDKAFKYEEEPGRPVRFQCEKYRGDSYFWPRAGVIASQPLTGITGLAAVRGLAEEMKSLWATESATLQAGALSAGRDAGPQLA